MLFGGGSITEALPGVWVQGEKSIHLRVTEEQRAQLIFEGKGNRENMGNKGTGSIFPPWEGLISSLYSIDKCIIGCKMDYPKFYQPP